MNGSLVARSALRGFTGPETIWDSETNFDMNHAPNADSIGRFIDLWLSALLLCYCCFLLRNWPHNVFDLGVT